MEKTTKVAPRPKSVSCRGAAVWKFCDEEKGRQPEKTHLSCGKVTSNVWTSPHTSDYITGEEKKSKQKCKASQRGEWIKKTTERNCIRKIGDWEEEKNPYYGKKQEAMNDWKLQTNFWLPAIQPNCRTGRIQDLVRGVSDKCPPTLSSLSNCCYLTSPFLPEKVWSKYLRLFHFRGFDRTTRTSVTPGSAQQNTMLSSSGAGHGMESQGAKVAYSLWLKSRQMSKNKAKSTGETETEW